MLMVTLTVCEFVIVMTAANQSIGADGYVDFFVNFSYRGL